MASVLARGSALVSLCGVSALWLGRPQPRRFVSTRTSSVSRGVATTVWVVIRPLAASAGNCDVEVTEVSVWVGGSVLVGYWYTSASMAGTLTTSLTLPRLQPREGIAFGERRPRQESAECRPRCGERCLWACFETTPRRIRPLYEHRRWLAVRLLLCIRIVLSRLGNLLRPGLNLVEAENSLRCHEGGWIKGVRSASGDKGVDGTGPATSTVRRTRR